MNDEREGERERDREGEREIERGRERVRWQLIILYHMIMYLERHRIN